MLGPATAPDRAPREAPPTCVSGAMIGERTDDDDDVIARGGAPHPVPPPAFSPTPLSCPPLRYVRTICKFHRPFGLAPICARTHKLLHTLDAPRRAPAAVATAIATEM